MNSNFISTASIKIVLPPKYTKDPKLDETKSQLELGDKSILYCYKDRLESFDSDLIDKEFIKIGRAETNQIVVNSVDFKDEEVAIIKVGKEIFFQSIHEESHVSFNGLNTPLYIVPENSRVIVKLKQHYIIYDNRADIQQPHELTPHITVSTPEQQTAYSDLTPILIGSSSICELRVNDPKSHKIHAMVYWTQNGIKLNIYSKTQKQELNLDLPHETLIQLYDSEFFIEYNGNISAKMKGLLNTDSSGHANYYLYDLNKQETFYEFQPFTKVLIGSEKTCQLPLSTEKLSRLLFCTQNNRLLLENQSSSCSCFVNGKAVNRQALHPGDLLKMDNHHFLILSFY